MNNCSKISYKPTSFTAQSQCCAIAQRSAPTPPPSPSPPPPSTAQSSASQCRPSQPSTILHSGISLQPLLHASSVVILGGSWNLGERSFSVAGVLGTEDLTADNPQYR